MKLLEISSRTCICQHFNMDNNDCSVMVSELADDKIVDVESKVVFSYFSERDDSFLVLEVVHCPW